MNGSWGAMCIIDPPYNHWRQGVDNEHTSPKLTEV